MIRCMIVDDEPNAHLVLKNYIDKTANLILSKQCYSVQEAITSLKTCAFDLVFLDLNLPDASGFSLIPLYPNTQVILTTAHAEYAVKSYEYHVRDYLLKPFSYDRFQKALQRITDQSTPVTSLENIELKVSDKMITFHIKDIIYIQSWGNYIKLFTETEEYICSSTTTRVYNDLPKDKFVRVHKSYIVNIDFVIAQDNEYVTLKNQTYLPIGITYRRILENLIRHE